jgi:ubiquitin C-terminal hydrolase
MVNQELPMFFGSQQHDAQEFLNFFLDKVSEDLNRAEIAPKKEESKEVEPSYPPKNEEVK